jgi:hypothetical protein
LGYKHNLPSTQGWAHAPNPSALTNIRHSTTSPAEPEAGTSEGDEESLPDTPNKGTEQVQPPLGELSRRPLLFACNNANEQHEAAFIHHLAQWMSRHQAAGQGNPLVTAPTTGLTFASWAMPPPDLPLGLDQTKRTPLEFPGRGIPPPPECVSQQHTPPPPTAPPGTGRASEAPGLATIRGVYSTVEGDQECDYAPSGNYPTCNGIAGLWVRTSKYKKLCIPCIVWVEGSKRENKDWDISGPGQPSSSTTPCTLHLDTIKALTYETALTVPQAVVAGATSPFDPWTTPGQDPWAVASPTPAHGPALLPSAANSSRAQEEVDPTIKLLKPFILAGDNAKQKTQNRSLARQAAMRAGVVLPLCWDH